MTTDIINESIEDKATRDAATATKRDLANGADVRVSTGQEKNPPERVDPFAARKALFKKHGDLRDAAEAKHRERNPGEAERASRFEGAPAPVAPGVPVPVAPAAAAPATPAAPAGASPAAPVYVTLQINGKPCRVSQADIDRAGGEQMYLARRRLDEDQLEVERQRDALRQAQAELEAQGERGRHAPSGQDDPATHPGGSPGTGPTDRGSRAEDVEAESARLAAMFFTGDEGDAKQAIADILRRAQGRGEDLSVDEVAERAAERLRQTQGNPAPAAPAAPSAPEETPVMRVVRQQINTMAAAEFPQVVNDDVARVAVFEKLREMLKLPENTDRRAVDVARDACEWGMLQFHNPRQAVIERKRELAPAQGADGAAPVHEDRPMSQSEFVALLQERRRGVRRS